MYQGSAGPGFVSHDWDREISPFGPANEIPGMHSFTCINSTHSLTSLHFNTIGPSGVRALPLGVAVERSVHYFCDYFSFFLLSSFSAGVDGGPSGGSRVRRPVS